MDAKRKALEGIVSKPAPAPKVPLSGTEEVKAAQPPSFAGGGNGGRCQRSRRCRSWRGPPPVQRAELRRLAANGSSMCSRCYGGAAPPGHRGGGNACRPVPKSESVKSSTWN